MLANRMSIVVRAWACAAVFCVATVSASAHPFPDVHVGVAQVPAATAPIETVAGTVKELVIDNRVTGQTTRQLALLLDDGRKVALNGSGLDALVQNQRVQANGQLSGDTLFLTAYHAVAGGAALAKVAAQVEGTLAMVHADNFDQGRSSYNYVVLGDDGSTTPLQLAVMPDSLQIGMRVVADGTTASDGFSLDADRITVLIAAPPKSADDILPAPITNNLLVVLVKFPGQTEAFSQAQVDQIVRTNGNSVANYYQEVSYGNQFLNVTVTPWLLSATAGPPTCDYATIGSAGDAAAAAAGYNPSSYQNRFYVFPNRADCGWAGLAYVGYPYLAWSNGYNQLNVYGHELGHNFGLLHAASLYCAGQVIGGSCSASEYGDPFDVMGNSSAMHFNAAQKSILNWISASAVKTHTTGTSTYTLSPIESPGGATYAVKVPVATKRTYWIEYRQPIGFDAGMSSYPNNGAQIRVGNPFEWVCGGCADDTELLDMTPGTANSFTDSALIAGQSYTDSAYNITFSVLSASPTALSVQVTASGATATTTTVTSPTNPAVVGATVTFTATVTGSTPSGTVNFTDGGASIGGCGAAALTGAGNVRTATCSTSALVAGVHSIVANYSGDTGNTASTSSAFSQVINATAGAFSNGGFEAPNLAGGYQYSPLGATWVFTGGAGITGNGNGFTSGNGPAPEGSQVAFLQRTGTATQTVNLAAGSYTLSLQAAQRGNYQIGAQIVAVQIDGVTVGQYQPPNASYSSYATPSFTIATSGNHTIALVGVGSGTDYTAFIDDVRLTPVSAPTFSNGGFEAPNLAGGYQYLPTGATWVFSGGAGITGNGNAFTSGNAPAPEGSQVAFLQRTGAATQTVNLAAGNYTLSLQAAQRGNYQIGTQIVAVQIDGVTVGQYQPPNASYSSYATPSFTIVASGNHTIALVSVGSGTDYTAFIDDVRLTPFSAPTFSNGGFEAPNLAGGYQYSPLGATWVFSGGAGITGNGNGFTNGNGPAPEGSQVAFLQRTGAATQTINLAAGNYTLSLQAAQRGNYQPGMQIVAVQVDGVTVGQYQPPNASYSSYATPSFTIAASGDHTIALVGVGSGTDYTAFIDDVRVH